MAIKHYGSMAVDWEQRIDFDRLRALPPRMVRDLPAGGQRLVQTAQGYVATLVAGETIFENGEATGAMPGRLIRGPQGRPWRSGIR